MRAYQPKMVDGEVIVPIVLLEVVHSKRIPPILYGVHYTNTSSDDSLVGIV